MVALRKESVDRNFNAVQIVIVIVKSLSARRAWIEIFKLQRSIDTISVALRKESVDRNFGIVKPSYRTILSLSARRAWIEI